MPLTLPGSAPPLRGEATVPGDKSISHRAALLGALARGESVTENYCPGQDNRSTLRCLRRLGVTVRSEARAARLVVRSDGLLREPTTVLDCGNSGTTMRLLSGILAPRPFLSVLSGDSSLRRRPMGRIVGPLGRMGADIRGRAGNTLAPLAISGRVLSGCDHDLPVASAQVKSALLLAGLSARGVTRVREPAASRDHTEVMLGFAGVELTVQGGWTSVAGGQEPAPFSLRVPGDASAAAFLLAAAAVVPGSDVTVREVGLNPTRTGFLSVLRRMGADLTVTPRPPCGREPAGNVRLVYRPLVATSIEAEEVPALIDELPVLAAVATQARGTTVVRGAAELRYKESDRLATTSRLLAGMGARVEETPDGLVVDGPAALVGAPATTHGDHRLAMAAAVAALCARGETVIDNPDCAAVSFPGFFNVITGLTGGRWRG